MQIENGCLVSLDVSMYDAQGQLLEQSESPLVYLHGAGDIFPRIEAALAGQEAGFRTSLLLEPEDAFGAADASLIHLVECRRLDGVNEFLRLAVGGDVVEPPARELLASFRHPLG